jgi:hypothetical protein
MLLVPKCEVKEAVYAANTTIWIDIWGYKQHCINVARSCYRYQVLLAIAKGNAELQRRQLLAVMFEILSDDQ